MIVTEKSPEEVKSLRFVLHKHQAKSLHYDLRLERDGVLKCWALPKGVPMVSKEKRLAIESGDHKTDLLYFSGIIPKGQYGAGEINIDDSGKYEILLWSDIKIEFILKGDKYKGRYILVRFQKAGPKTWLLMKAD
ncbi:MAG: ATP-dependent DNA ligase [Methanomicrobiaceae archaeon]|nr:ATP-dependent DNA ligase [Methanomicrobiaceae archaeon]